MKLGLSCSPLKSLGPSGKTGRQVPINCYKAGNKSGELKLVDGREAK